MKYLTFPKPFRLFYTASHPFSGRVLKAKCSGPISGNIIRTVVQARMRDRSTTKILSGCRRMTIAYHFRCFLFFTHLHFGYGKSILHFCLLCPTVWTFIYRRCPAGPVGELVRRTMSSPIISILNRIKCGLQRNLIEREFLSVTKWDRLYYCARADPHKRTRWRR
jgi:hypothetical protein